MSLVDDHRWGLLSAPETSSLPSPPNVGVGRLTKEATMPMAISNECAKRYLEAQIADCDRGVAASHGPSKWPLQEHARVRPHKTSRRALMTCGGGLKLGRR